MFRCAQHDANEARRDANEVRYDANEIQRDYEVKIWRELSSTRHNYGL